MLNLEQTLQRVIPLATQLRHELHAHPELSGQEVWTKQRLMDFLHEHSGLELFDRGHYFYALYRGKSNAPAIAFRADFDALPIEDEIDAAVSFAMRGGGA